MGLHHAGFDVIGIDIKPQPRYPFTFIQADALRPPINISDFDLIWASPPCQAFSSASGFQRKYAGKEYPNYIPDIRAMLSEFDGPTCIENVPQAPIRPDLVLDGTMFSDLRVIRKRHFELNFTAPFRLGFPSQGLVINHGWSCVVGHGTPSWLWTKGVRTSNSDHKTAMGIEWMTREELSQAIPPAYAEFIGRAALTYLTANSTNFA